MSCSTCALAEACTSTRLNCQKNTKKPQSTFVDEEDGESISERLTQDSSNNYSILYLFIAAVVIFALVLLFTVLVNKV